MSAATKLDVAFWGLWVASMVAEGWTASLYLGLSIFILVGQLLRLWK